MKKEGILKGVFEEGDYGIGILSEIFLRVNTWKIIFRFFMCWLEFAALVKLLGVSSKELKKNFLTQFLKSVGPFFLMLFW